MDEKTEELREIFMDVADEETVTERQEDPRGSLAGGGAAVADRIRDAVEEMRAVFEFSTDLSDDALVTVVRRFFEGESDAAIADAVGTDRREVVRARFDLHLLRDRDTDAPFDLDRFRDLLDDGRPVADIAAALDVSASTVRRYRRVVEAQREARSVSRRFRTEFEDAVGATLGDQLTEDVTQDGLEEATEGAEPESNLSF